MLRDPVCDKRIHRNHAHAHIEYEHIVYYLCCPLCQAAFEAAPEQYARPELGERAGDPERRASHQQRIGR